MTTDKYTESAIKAGEWFLNTQNDYSETADFGRYVYARNLETGFESPSSGWQTAFAVFAMLSLHKLTGDDKYLESAANGMSYIKTLQILDPRRKSRFGAILEVTPQSKWLHPRDALSSAWAMLGFYKYTKEEDYLERTVFFADWLLEYAMNGDWPMCTINIYPGGTASDDVGASCQSGAILFFLDLYKATDDMRYYRAAKRIADVYVDQFIEDDGNIRILIDFIGNNPGVNDEKKWPLDWQNMHRVNDDFGGISLVFAYDVFKQELYLKKMIAYFNWVEAKVKDDGSFFDPFMEVGSATVPVFLNEFKKCAPGELQDRIESLNTKCLDFLMSVQMASENERINGGFKGMDDRCKCGNGKWINIRCSAYAILALTAQTGNSAFPI